jgi:ATP-dependent Clp protease adapter protein ClpS
MKNQVYGPMYKVLLLNDNINRRRDVVQILTRIFEGMTIDEATVKMLEAHNHGRSIVRVCEQYKAEDYCTKLRQNGFLSLVEY